MPVSPFGDIGPCQVNWKQTAIASIHEDGATFRLTAGTAGVKEAEYGTAEVDAIFTGYEIVEFEAPFTRLTYTNLQKLVPGSSLSGSLSVVGHAQRLVGTSLYSVAQELIVKRIVNGIVDTDESKWLHLFKTYPIPRFDIPYNLGTQRAFMVLFKAFPLQAAGGSKDRVGASWRIGGPAAYTPA